MPERKIMIIGAGDFQLPLVEEAAKTCNVVLVAPSVDERFKKLATAVYLTDVRNVDEIENIARKEKIDGVITDQTDIPVYTVASVAERLGLPGISSETALLFTNKTTMREKMTELNLPVLPYKTVSTLQEASDFFKSLNAPCIVKPLDSQGSRGVFKIENEKALAEKFPEAASYSKDGRVLIEKFVTGDEFVIESAVADGRSKMLICGDTHYFDIPDAFAAKSRIFPSVRPASLIAKAQELNRKIIEGFGLKQGVTHGEYIIDGDEVYLIEIGARGGGVFISSDLISLSAGLNTEKFLINLALGKQNGLPETQNKNIVCGYLAFFLHEGVVCGLDGVEDVKALPYVARHQLDKIRIGMEIGKATDKTSRFALILQAPDRREFYRRAGRIKELLKIKTRCGEREALPIWE